MNEIDLTQLDLNLLVTFEVLMAESSVTRAATRLGRTQSAVSHSLARLREQLGDPLMVKQGGRMRPSPFAEQLIEDVRPILRGILERTRERANACGDSVLSGETRRRVGWRGWRVRAAHTINWPRWRFVAWPSKIRTTSCR